MRQACSMAPLVEARRVGRLDARGAASVERHLSACAECAALARDLDRLAKLARRPIPPLPPLEHQRGRVRLLQAAARPSSSIPPARRRGSLLAGMAAAVTVAASIVARDASRPQPAPALARVARLAWSTVPRTSTIVRGAAGARFTRSAEGTAEIVALESGSIYLSVRTLAQSERFIVRTSDAEVEVRGTVFEVEAAEGRVRRVSVSEGKVLVRFHDGTVLVEAGASWSPPPEEAPAAATEPAPKRSADARRSTEVAESSAGAPSATAGGAAPPPLAPAVDEASRAFADGVTMIDRGDYAAAAAKLDAFGAAHPGDARADDAAFLAIVALQRAGRRPEAAEAARRYLARFPAGQRRAEVEAIAKDR